jgi:hypothetical protein
MAGRPGAPTVEAMTTGTTQDHDGQHDGSVRADDGPRLRASDADRSATAQVLEDAVARGLLTHDEGGARMAEALASRFRDELPPLTADLPPITAPSPLTAPAPGWRSLGSTLVTQVHSELHATRIAGPRSRRFLLSALVVLLLLGILVTLGALAVHGLVDGGHGPVDGGHGPHSPIGRH